MKSLEIFFFCLEQIPRKGFLLYKRAAGEHPVPLATRLAPDPSTATPLGKLNKGHVRDDRLLH